MGNKRQAPIIHHIILELWLWWFICIPSKHTIYSLSAPTRLELCIQTKYHANTHAKTKKYITPSSMLPALIHENPIFGEVAMVEVGATNVGSIQQSFVPGRPVQKGDEKGLFAFGGSCVITIFHHGRLQFDADLLAQSAEQRETYARMGDRLGVAP